MVGRKKYKSLEITKEIAKVKPGRKTIQKNNKIVKKEKPERKKIAR